MNILAPISTLMTADIIVVAERDLLSRVHAIFKGNPIYHIPVTRLGKVVGIISRDDLLLFMKGLGEDILEKVINETRLNNYKAEVIMTHSVAEIEANDPIKVALDLFSKNLFRVLPVMKNDKLVGIVTTFDIIKKVHNKPPRVTS